MLSGKNISPLFFQEIDTPLETKRGKGGGGRQRDRQAHRVFQSVSNPCDTTKNRWYMVGHEGITPNSQAHTHHPGPAVAKYHQPVHLHEQHHLHFCYVSTSDGVRLGYCPHSFTRSPPGTKQILSPRLKTPRSSHRSLVPRMTATLSPSPPTPSLLVAVVPPPLHPPQLHCLPLLKNDGGCGGSGHYPSLSLDKK